MIEVVVVRGAGWRFTTGRTEEGIKVWIWMQSIDKATIRVAGMLVLNA